MQGEGNACEGEATFGQAEPIEGAIQEEQGGEASPGDHEGLRPEDRRHQRRHQRQGADATDASMPVDVERHRQIPRCQKELRPRLGAGENIGEHHRGERPAFQVFALKGGIEQDSAAVGCDAHAEFYVFDAGDAESLVKPAHIEEGCRADGAATRPERPGLAGVRGVGVMVEEIAKMADGPRIGRLVVIGAKQGDQFRVFGKRVQHPVESVGGQFHIAIDKEQQFAPRASRAQIAGRGGARSLPRFHHPDAGAIEPRWQGWGHAIKHDHELGCAGPGGTDRFAEFQSLATAGLKHASPRSGRHDERNRRGRTSTATSSRARMLPGRPFQEGELFGQAGRGRIVGGEGDQGGRPCWRAGAVALWPLMPRHCARRAWLCQCFLRRPQRLC